MKRMFCAMFAVLFLLLSFSACQNSSANVYEHERFSLALPEGWGRIYNEDVVAFGPGNAGREAANISFYVTEKNYYFDEFTAVDYADFAPSNAGYSSVSDVVLENLRIDGWKAHRVSMQATIDDLPFTLILYAIDAEDTLFFVLLQPEGDAFVSIFDKNMKAIKIH